METGVLRVVVIVALFFLLTADYSTLLQQLFRAMGVSPSPPPSAAAESRSRVKRDTASREEFSVKGPRMEHAMNFFASNARSTLMSTIKNACLPKLICELNASPHKEKLTDSEKSLLSLISDTSISVTAEVTSKYHFAAHMGQLIAGVEGAGCHNFYPTCPFPGAQVLHMMKKVKIR